MKYLAQLSSLVFVFVILAGFAVAPHATHAATNTQMCYELYQPVCGAQQVECFAAPCYPVYKTYSNSCFMQAENATIVHEGVCSSAETGPVGKPGTTTPPVTTKPYTPPAGCIAWFDGCNSCSMTSSGHSICTMMACQINNSSTGYCKAYAATTTPVVTPPHHTPIPTPVVTSSTTVSASSTATSTEPVHTSFFSRLWHTILGWFGFH